MPDQVKIKHGSPHAYKACRRRPEGACDVCKQAHASYVDDWREERKRTDPDSWRRHLDQQAARRRAHTALERAHPDEYQRLFAAALREITETRRSP